MIDNMKIGRALRTLRKRAGYTQKELADQLFLSKMAVSKWENGKSIPDIEILRKLAILLDMDVDGLIDGTATYYDDPWKGVLFLDSSDTICAETTIFDKPLIDYLVSYFLLAGIRNLLIVCGDQDKSYIIERYHHGEKLGVCIRYQQRGILDLETIVSTDKEWFEGSNLMIVPEPFFIYGVDLTRFIQRAMQYKEQVVNLVSVVGDIKSQFSYNLQVDREDRSNLSSYCYQSVPFFFLPTDIISKTGKTSSIDEFMSSIISKKQMIFEVMDKGYIVSGLRTDEDVAVISRLVELIQNLCLCKIYCPLEIAWRRGMIDKETMRSNSSAFVEYKSYLKSL